MSSLGSRLIAVRDYLKPRPHSEPYYTPQRLGAWGLAALSAVILVYWLVNRQPEVATANQAGKQLLPASLSAIVGDGVAPGFKEVGNRQNEDAAKTTEKFKALNERVDSFDKRFQAGLNSLDLRLKKIEDVPPINREEMEKDITDRVLKALPAHVPVSRLEKLEKEVAALQAQPNFPRRSIS